MPCSVVNSQQNLQARLPTLPQSLPKTQAEWTAFLNSLGTSLQILKQETHPPNIIPQQLQTFGTSTASTSTAALSATNCTPSVDATQQFYGGASLKVVISASGATLAFAGFPIAIAAATRWFCAFQILATSGATGSLTVATSAGHSITENFTISSSASWQGVWGLFDFRQFGDTQASWTFTFTSTATLWLDGLQMNAVGDPLTFLPKFNGVQLTSGTASTFTGTLDGIADGTTYARNLASYLVNGRPYSYKGLYSGTTTYNPGDEVNSNNNYYLCTALTTGNAPPNASFWQTLGPATLDALSDGSTYQRMPTANMDANRRGLIDFTQAGHLGKNFDNLLDGASRFAVTNGANLGGVSSFDINNRALIDFLQGGHLNKNVDNIPDGSTYARALAAYLKGGRPYNLQGAWSSATTYHQGDEVTSGGNYYLALATSTNTPPPNVLFWQLLGPTSLDNVTDGSTYARALATYLKSGRPYNLQGAWSSTTTYHQGDEVTSGGNYYLALSTSTNVAPPNVSFWQLLGPTTLDSVTDGSTYARFLALGLTGGIANTLGLIAGAATDLSTGSCTNTDISTNTNPIVCISIAIGPYAFSTEVVVTMTGEWNWSSGGSGTQFTYGISDSPTVFTGGGINVLVPAASSASGVVAQELTFFLPANTSATYYLIGDKPFVVGTSLELTCVMKCEVIKR